jgi:hypothetical protein
MAFMGRSTDFYHLFCDAFFNGLVLALSITKFSFYYLSYSQVHL